MESADALDDRLYGRRGCLGEQTVWNMRMPWLTDCMDHANALVDRFTEHAHALVDRLYGACECLG